MKITCNNSLVLLLCALSSLSVSCGEVPTEVEFKPAFKEKAWERFNFRSEIFTIYEPSGVIDDYYLGGNTTFVEEVDKYEKSSPEATMNIYVEKSEEITHSKSGKNLSRPGSMDGKKHNYVKTYLGERKNFNALSSLPTNQNFSFLQPIFPAMIYKYGVEFTEKKILYFGRGTPVAFNITYKVAAISIPYDDCITFDVNVSSDTVSQGQGESKPAEEVKSQEESTVVSPSIRGADGMIAEDNEVISTDTGPADIPLTVKGNGTYYYFYKKNMPFSHTLNMTLEGSPGHFGLSVPKGVERTTIKISMSLVWNKS